MSTIPIHLVVRFADSMMFSEGIDTIKMHSDVLDRRGAVWFAKFGKTLGMNHIERINLQIESGIGRWLFDSAATPCWWITNGGWRAEPTHWMPLPDPPSEGGYE